MKIININDSIKAFLDKEVMRCPKCGRLHVFSREHDFERIAVFVEEKQDKKK